MKMLIGVLVLVTSFRFIIAGILLSALPYITDNILKFLIWGMGLSVIVYALWRTYLMVGFIRKISNLENQE